MSGARPRVVVRPAEDADVATLVAVAVRGALPREVMPPDPDPEPDRWTARREEAYAAFVRSRRAPWADGTREVPLVVEVDGVAAGLARLLSHPGTGDGRLRAETGVWLSREVRGRGVTGALLDALVTRARREGADELVADTTVGNVPAVAALRRHGAVLTPREGEPGVLDAVIRLTGDGADTDGPL